MSVASLNEWVPGPVAAGLLGLKSVKGVRRLAERGFIGVRQVPGGHPRYSRPDTIRVVQESTRPALRLVGRHAEGGADA
jgi:hypothetical protein